MCGWIKLHRKMTEWEWYDDANTFRLFFHCLLMANHKPKSWRGLDIKRGSFWTSLDKLVEQTGLSKSVIRTCFKHLELTGELTCKSHSTGRLRGRMVTVVKYGLYQGDDSELTHKLTGKQHTNDTQIAPTKNDKNEKKTNAATLDGFALKAFDKIYSELPAWKNKEKAQSKKKWLTATKDKSDDQIRFMVNGVLNYLEDEEESGKEINYIKRLPAIINQKIWESYEDIEQ